MLARKISTGDYILMQIPEILTDSQIYHILKPVYAIPMTHSFNVVQGGHSTYGTAGDYLVRPSNTDDLYIIPKHLFESLFEPVPAKETKNESRKPTKGKS